MALGSRTKAFSLIAGGVASAVVLLPAAAASPPLTTRVSVNSLEEQANGLSAYTPALSADGRYVAFTSAATNLVAGDTNGVIDVFVRDRAGGETTRASVDGGGAQANGESSLPAISGDGRFVAYVSGASNLVQGDTNGSDDVFVRDRVTGATSRVSVSSSGLQANRESMSPAISDDGRYVAFQSGASNLVSGDTNGLFDIFVHDRQSGETTRVSVSSSGVQGNDSSVQPKIGADGRFVAFFSPASNLVAGDTNGNYDAFLHDRATGETSRASVDSDGVQGNSFTFDVDLSDDGRFVAFQSLSTNLVHGDTNNNFDIFVHDFQAGATTRVSVSTGGAEGNNGSYAPAISGDGRFVAFDSFAATLVQPDQNGVTPDVFLHDGVTGTTTLSSVNSQGVQGDLTSRAAALTRGARVVAFRSNSTNLVAGDTNGVDDMFVAAQRPLVSSRSTPPR